MQISTSINVCFGQGPVRQQMKRVYDAGFRAMDINFNDWVDMEEDGRFFPFSEEQWNDWIQEIKSFVNDYGITLTQAHGPLFNIFEESPRGEHLRQMCEKSLRAAAKLNIPWVVFHAGTGAGDFSSREHIEALKAANHAFFDPLVKVAEEVHVGIALENMFNAALPADGGMYCSITEDLIDLVDSFHSEYVGICWDTGHAHVQGVDQRACFHQMGDRLKVLHVHDNNGLRDQHTAPFFGTINWKEITKGLAEINYQGDFTFESQTLIHQVPDSCKDAALHLLYKIGRQLVAQIKA